MAALVVALGAAVFLNWKFSMNGTQVAQTDGDNYGAAKYVANQSVGSASATSSDYFSKARLDRQKAQDAALEVLNKVTSGNASVKQQTVSEITALSKAIKTENDIETLILAKGFKDCVAVVNDTGVQVVVKPKGTTDLSESDAIQIKDIVVAQTSIDPLKIQIIQAK